jgi:hypothetical protein
MHFVFELTVLNKKSIDDLVQQFSSQDTVRHLTLGIRLIFNSTDPNWFTIVNTYRLKSDSSFTSMEEVKMYLNWTPSCCTVQPRPVCVRHSTVGVAYLGTHFPNSEPLNFRSNP